MFSLINNKTLWSQSINLNYLKLGKLKVSDVNNISKLIFRDFNCLISCLDGKRSSAKILNPDLYAVVCEAHSAPSLAPRRSHNITFCPSSDIHNIPPALPFVTSTPLLKKGRLFTVSTWYFIEYQKRAQ
jgi:hypothetical protein